MGEEELCRLCAESRAVDDLLKINDEYWLKQQLESKIFQFFRVKILLTDKLPKCICSKCCEKVNVTWEFNQKIQQAQNTLRSIFTDENLSIDDNRFCSTAMKSENPESENNSTFEFVECIITDNNQGKKMIPETDNLSKSIATSSTPKRKKKMNVQFKTNTNVKRKPGRTKTRRSKKKTVTESEESEQDDNMSVLSGASEAEKNEDGSLVFNSLETWESYPWMCIECNENLKNNVELRNHYQNIHNQTPKYICVECSKVYTKYYGFISHVRCHRYHLRFCCDACNKFFANKKLLESHRTTHYDARPFSCVTCGKTFRMQSALYVHSRSHLPLEVKNKYPCDQCHKRFGTKPNLMAHKRIHTGIRDYTCDQCGKSFIQKGNLDNHMLTHTAARPFNCETCGKSFKTLMRLKKHESVHSGLKPHQCDVCGRQFRERGTLREHHRIHTGAMPFTCEFCGKCFRFKGVLTTHRRQHTGERPYSCQECQHHFTNWPNYNKHMKRRHGINTSVTTRKPQTIPPTGMPHRNPPGTVVTPNGQVLIVQETSNSVQSAATAFTEPEQTVAIAEPEVRSNVSTLPANVTAVNSQPTHLSMQNYYMYMYQ